MNSRTNTLCGRIRAVKSWLSRAETNFGEKNYMRGEINLLLAQAEMRHLREKEGWRCRRRVLAAGAVCLTVLGIVFYGVLRRPQQAVSYSPPRWENRAETAGEKPKTEKPAAALPQKEFAAAANPPVAVEKLSEQAREEEAVASFNEEQMRNLVRMAGRALRGRG